MNYLERATTDPPPPKDTRFITIADINAKRKQYAINYPYGWEVLQKINTVDRPTFVIDSYTDVWIDREGFINIFNKETTERITFEDIVEFMEYIENEYGEG